MKTIVIIHNLNSRGKNINEDYVRELLNKKGMKFHYFQTKRISDVDVIIKKYNNPSEFQYCSDGLLYFFIISSTSEIRFV